METKQAIILKCVGGLYTCLEKSGQEAADRLFSCAARGIFRKDGRSPVAGDHVRLSVADDGSGCIEEIFPRRTFLVRPPIANAEMLAVVASVVAPAPNPLIIDKMLAVAEYAGIHPIIIINKTDLPRPKNMPDSMLPEEIYRRAGYDAFTVSAETGEGIESLRECIRGKFCVFAGNSGVGKSSILNALDSRFELATGETSKKLGRGRHTTRVTELLCQPDGGFLADTPGFSTFDMAKVLAAQPEELPALFREFEPMHGKCRFADCRHLEERDCAVADALREGIIDSGRYHSYTAIYRELEMVKYEKRNFS